MLLGTDGVGADTGKLFEPGEQSVVEKI